LCPSKTDVKIPPIAFIHKVVKENGSILSATSKKSFQLQILEEIS
jgi:hypothetical protein